VAHKYYSYRYLLRRPWVIFMIVSISISQLSTNWVSTFPIHVAHWHPLIIQVHLYIARGVVRSTSMDQSNLSVVGMIINSWLRYNQNEDYYSMLITSALSYSSSRFLLFHYPPLNVGFLSRTPNCYHIWDSLKASMF